MRIALVGKSMAGRTFCAFYLAEKHKIKRFQMKNGVDSLLRKLYDFEPYKRITWEYRLRVYDAMYKLDNDIWINYLMRRLRKKWEQTGEGNIVVEDVRYLNELKVLKDNGFVVVRIIAPESRRKKKIATLLDAADNSIVLQEWFNSEAFSGQVDYAILNDTRAGTKKALDDLVQKLSENLT